MRVIGAEMLDSLVSGLVLDVKMVFNERGAILFSSERQHREMKVEGISYEDNYAGDALAAMVRRDVIEVRYHRAFVDSQVSRIVSLLKAMPEFVAMRNAAAMYQGRVLV